MGHASSISLALSQYTKKKIACIDGDGAFLMHLGFISMINQQSGDNFNHFIINNGLHESVGFQESLIKNIDVKKIGESAGYKNVSVINCLKNHNNNIKSKIKNILSKNGPNLICLNVGVKTRDDLSRPKESRGKSSKL